MKKLLCAFLAILMAMAFLSCGNNEIKNENEMAYKIYVRGYRKGMASANVNGKEIRYYNADNLYLEDYSDSFDREEINEKTPLSKTVNINGKEMSFVYEKTLHSDLTESKNIKQIGSIDVYSLPEKSVVKAEFDQRTGKLLYYIDPDTDKLGELTLEDARREAVAFIQSQYGADALEGYTETLCEAKQQLGIWLYDITYTKYLSGYKTPEFINVCFDTTGKLIVFHARTRGVVDALKEDLSEEKIQNAEKTLRSTFAEGAVVQDERRILIDAESGVCYLEMTVNDKVYYINII